MSCELRLIAPIDGLDKYKEFLTQGNKENDLNFQNWIVSTSPTGDRLVLAHSSAILVLTQRWDLCKSGESRQRFAVTCQWDAAQNLLQSDTISSVSCLPLVATTHASHGGIDWTCLAVGFTSGYLRLFTENMDLLAEEKLHPEPVLRIKPSSYRKGSQTSFEGSETVFVVYPSVICSFAGFSLFQTLRGLRGQVALKHASGRISHSEVTLDYNKYALSSSSSTISHGVRDGCVISSCSVNNFDHLVNCSLSEGFHGNYKPSAPHHCLIATTGDWPWLRYQHTQEGTSAPLELTDVALTVISKLPGWLGLGSHKIPEPQVKAAEKLNQRFALLDRRRQGRSLIVSPDGSLLAVADALGRVSLIESRTGVVLRMWKGYRDAECGFLEVDEEKVKSRHSRHNVVPRKAVFLAIYCSKKSLLEIFSLRFGPRVAAIRVSKNGRLIYTPHGLLGFSTPPQKGNNNSSIPVSFVCEDGLLEVVVPFHCSLADGSSARAKDLHLLKQLKLWLKGDEFDSAKLVEETTTLAQKLTTDEIKLQTIDMMSAFNQITTSALTSVASVFLEETGSSASNSSQSTGRNLNLVCKQLKDVLGFIEFLLSLKGKPDVSDVSDSPISTVLFLSEQDASMLLQFVMHMQKITVAKQEGRVKFNVCGTTDLSRFLNCLDFGVNGPVQQKSTTTDEDLTFLGEFMFSDILKFPEKITDWFEKARKSDIHPMLFARSLLTFWLQRGICDIEKDMRLLVSLMKAVSMLPGLSVASADCSCESPWWKSLREVIASSRFLLPGVAAAVSCRAVSLHCEQEQEVALSNATEAKEIAEEAIFHDWENISADTWQWDLLITHLEDTALLNTILAFKLKTKESDPMLATVSFESQQFSLAELLKKGEGAVSDLVSKWLCQFGLHPDQLVDKSDVEFQSVPSKEESPMMRGRKSVKGDEEIILPLIDAVQEIQPLTEYTSTIVGHIKTLKTRFPYSLTSSVLLSNMSWVLFSAWHQDLPNIILFETALSYLEAIPSTHLRSGICNLAWSTYIKTLLEGITRLVGKVGRLPTDQLCSREIGIPRQQISAFMSCVNHLLTIMLDANAERPQIPFINKKEALWVEGPSSLVSVAVVLPMVDEELVVLHQQLAQTLYLITALDLRQPRLLPHLFDSLKAELFGDLTKRREISLNHPGLTGPRINFLKRAVAAAVQTVQVVEGSGNETRLDTDVVGKWFRMCCDIANAWRLPLEDLRRQYVCELYCCGYDRLAEEVLPAVVETDQLSQELLIIVGQRVNALVSSSQVPVSAIANLSPTLTAWLDKLDEDGLKEVSCKIEDTELLATRVHQWLPDDVIARLLAESIASLAD